ncbi:MAG TPA: hypothetical protein VLG14_01205 [Sphingomonas sp.]|nr:hypothetical protein [Sphingomonas sp.]
MSDEVDTRVSLSLDPERFRLIDGYNDDTRQFVDGVINAYNDIHQTLGKAHTARALAESNPALTPENRVLIVAREVDGAKKRVLARLANAERDLRANIAHTESLLSQPLTERAGMGTLNGEVRAHLKSLSRSDREKFMTEALERDDVPTLEAILGGQPFLSGFTQIDHDHYVRTYHKRKNPQLVRRLDLMKRFLDEIERNTPVVHAQFDKAIGEKASVVAGLKQLEDQSKAAFAALKIEPTA